ncbi:uncharacterized protein MYCFIDRAFT_194085 [Pseudocercospora fijiensis CIRAD86]|uniref:Uncharacterized protein n=1 Tax=Pseudocercospora fijiensis (strain CIRAD86) TaxID=383855 RepID=M2Z7Y4_PSEFD|nr:uncharacterized protein MYCFIDRAFT_194085 [Pseudocercospora fijiensis CIRAD86]EME85880.1 hypothetical protein MYCFIDRAFT_194085 [Pseudocercospora fijiensis CIRAD86]
MAMESPLLSLPREIRDIPAVISEIVIVNDQPFRVKPRSRTGIVSKSNNGLASTCKQMNAEYSHLLRKAAFTPGSRTVAPIYNFDFTEMIAFVRTLKKHEIQSANCNKNLAVNLFISTITTVEAQRLMEWLKVAETFGIELQYVVRWTSFDMKSLKSMEAVVGQTREGRKIMKALGAGSVGAWSWESYQWSLKNRSC